MNITLEGASEAFIEHLVQTGQYASPHEVVDDLVRERQWREEKLQALRASIRQSLAEDDMSEAEFDASIAATIEELKQAKS